MSQQFFAPIVGETVRNDSTGADGGEWIQSGSGKRWQPSSNTLRSSSLHSVHLRPTAVQEEALPAPQPIEAPQQQYYDAQPQASNFTQEGNMGALSTHEQMPDLDEDFDPYDSAQLNALVERRVQAALAPSRQAQNEQALAAQYNQCVEQFGSDGNFQSSMNRALEMCVADARAGKSIDISSAYERASEEASKKSGGRVAHLPPRARTVAGLGQLIQHNHETKRARPYRSR